MARTPITREALDALVSALRGEALEAHRRGEMERASELDAKARALELEADWLVGRGASLTPKARPLNVKQVTPQHRENISRSMRPDDPNMAAARAKGIRSMRQLADRLGVTASFLSQINTGSRPMPDHLAAAFKRLTGKDWQ